MMKNEVLLAVAPTETINLVKDGTDLKKILGYKSRRAI